MSRTHTRIYASAFLYTFVALFAWPSSSNHAGVLPEEMEASPTEATGSVPTPDSEKAETGLGEAPGSDASRLAARLLTNIEVSRGENEATVILTGDGRLAYEAQVVDAKRILVDVTNVTSAVRQPVISVRHPLLKRIRLGYHQDKVRLVMDLEQAARYEAKEEKDRLVIRLVPDRATDAPTMPTPIAASPAMEATQNPLPPAMAEPVSLTPSKKVPLSERVMGDRPNRPRVKARLAQMVTPAAQEEPDTAEKSSGKEQDLVAGQTRYVGRRISLDFQQADISNVLRLIAEVSGINIVVGEGVKAKVTMKLVSVPWDQALDMLLRMNGLGMIRQGNIVWVDTLLNIAQQQDNEARAKDSKSKAEELVTRVFYVRNVSALDLQNSLRQYLSPRGVMNFNQATNALIVRDADSKMTAFKQLVEGLDLEVPQVQIEARIVQADTSYSRSFGVQWGFNRAYTTDGRSYVVSNLTGPFSQLTQAGNTGTVTNSFIVNLPAAVSGLTSVPALGFTTARIGGITTDIDIRLSAGELLGLAKVIASPKIVTLDNKEAKIAQGESIPFQTTSLQGTQTTFVDANLELQVTPQIASRDPKEEGKRILLKVRATRNAVGARSNPAGPSIDRREATTQVLIRDGETVVLGGVFVDTQNNNVAGMPYLSRIPVLGWLFKNKTEAVSKQELLIFLTPSIVKA
jgi:type IV pilus assembly protein PilQ